MVHAHAGMLVHLQKPCSHTGPGLLQQASQGAASAILTCQQAPVQLFRLRDRDRRQGVARHATTSMHASSSSTKQASKDRSVSLYGCQLAACLQHSA